MTEPLIPAPPLPEVAPEQLRWKCDPSAFRFRDTSELEPIRDIIGQDRALRAIQLGLEMKSPGYNIFLSGFVGTGRNTTVSRVLQKLDRGEESPPDLCYVFNFRDPDCPRALLVPASKGCDLVQRMRRLVRQLARDVPKVFEGQTYQRARATIRKRYEKRQRSVVEQFQKRAEKEGFALVQVQAGAIANPEVVPLIDGEPKFLSDLEEAVDGGTFDAKKLEQLRDRQVEFSSELPTVFKEAMKVETEMMVRIQELDVRSVKPIVATCVSDVRDAFSELPEVLDYLEQVQEHVLENLAPFVGTHPIPRPSPTGNGIGEPEEPGGPIEYRVNLVVDNRRVRGAPVLTEDVATSAHLFGFVERSFSTEGEGPVNHMKIKGGRLHEANGGYLILNTSDLFSEPPDVWNQLKRVLRTGKLEIPTSPPGSMLGPSPVKPEPVPISVKVVLIGDHHQYAILHAYEEDFRKIFKVRADFDTEMSNGLENIVQYGSFVQRLAQEEGILAFDRGALSATAEYGSRLAGRKSKLSTRFNLIADLAREATYFARLAGAKKVGAEHVEKALEEKDHRDNLAEEKMREQIEDGSIFIDVEGQKVGTVNGLAVYESGDHVFGLPSRITATVSLGNAGIINIEREADLSGRTHDKGVQILSGYLRSKYAQEKPLTLSASLCFEQSYSGIDGDSASSTELFALLSAIAKLPLRQDVAVTGSVNQSGEIQPIGGVNEKIEGFFAICEARGLTGTQGVMIPASNVPDLMLRRRVVEAVREGRFHVWAVGTMDQGFEVLTGVAAGDKQGRRAYPLGTANGRVDQRLKKLANLMRDYGGHN
jgi:lon-related putative ATP-dependent protease